MQHYLIRFRISTSDLKRRGPWPRTPARASAGDRSRVGANRSTRRPRSSSSGTPAPAGPPFTDAQLQQIQGFGIAGFRKDHQETLFVRIASPAGGKQLLTLLAPQIACAWEVGTFNALFKEVLGRTGDEP